jgi:tetratricopeptide (TPR) repeat protein
MIKTYERIAEKGYKSVEMFQKLGNCYFYNSEMDKAVRWYCELFEMNSDLDSEYYYRYAKALRSIGENDKAFEILAKLNQQPSNK